MANNRVSLTAIADVRSERAMSLKDAYGHDTVVYEDYQQMLYNEELNFVIVNLPHETGQ